MMANSSLDASAIFITTSSLTRKASCSPSLSTPPTCPTAREGSWSTLQREAHSHTCGRCAPTVRRLGCVCAVGEQMEAKHVPEAEPAVPQVVHASAL
jgi:hypothetical protein